MTVRSAVPQRVRRYLLEATPGVVRAVSEAADAVAADWDGDATTERARVVGPLKRELDGRGLTELFPRVLAGAVDAAGSSLPAPPVAAPPYVVVTSTGPVLRATLSDGRLVIRLHVFTVERSGGGGRDDPARYVRGPTNPASIVEVEFR